MCGRDGLLIRTSDAAPKGAGVGLRRGGAAPGWGCAGVALTNNIALD